MVYYAVAKGRVPGIYLTWAEAERQVRGFSGALYQKFLTKDRAEDFMHRGMSPGMSSSIPVSMPSSSGYADGEDKVYTDGSFAEGLAGYGWVYIPKGSSVHTLTGSGPVRGKLTNNTGELTAIFDAITKITVRPLQVYSDSKYSIKCITEWYPKWAQNGFVTAKGKPVKNLELIQNIRNYMFGVTFHHVKAHAGHVWNEMADRLADEGRKMI